MMEIAICNNNNAIVNQIENLILGNRNMEKIHRSMDAFYSGEALENNIINGARYDMIFLDMQLDKEDAIDIGRNIRRLDRHALLIFLSEYGNFSSELFRLNTFALIEKPIDAKKFQDIFQEAIEKIFRDKVYFLYQYKNLEYKVLCNDILFFESQGRQIKVNFQNGEIGKFNGKLNEVESELLYGINPFLRVHQSYLVNYHNIAARSRTSIILRNGTKLPISENRQKAFHMKYGELLRC